MVPDIIDDIVADIGQEDKEEGTVNGHTHTNKIVVAQTLKGFWLSGLLISHGFNNAS